MTRVSVDMVRNARDLRKTKTLFSIVTPPPAVHYIRRTKIAIRTRSDADVLHCEPYNNSRKRFDRNEINNETIVRRPGLIVHLVHAIAYRYVPRKRFRSSVFRRVTRDFRPFSRYYRRRPCFTRFVVPNVISSAVGRRRSSNVRFGAIADVQGVNKTTDRIATAIGITRWPVGPSVLFRRRF